MVILSRKVGSAFVLKITGLLELRGLVEERVA